MVEEKTVLETPVKVEFNIDRSIAEFNIREKVLELLELMKAVDTTMKVKSTVTQGLEWDELDNMPEDDSFTTNFQVREFTFRKVRKIVVHLTFTTTIPINRIKYTPSVKDFIFQHNVWLKTDWFNTKIESSPGIIVMINPKLLNKEVYKEELLAALKLASSNISLERGVEKEDCRPDTHLQNENIQVPIFYLENSIKKWGGLSAEVIRINCAKEESEKLKFLMSAASEQGLIKKGAFVPAGLHLMEGKSVVTNIMKEQVEHLQESTGIPLTGLTSSEMNSHYSPDQTIKEMIEQIKGVDSVELLRENHYQGHWTIVTKQRKAKSVLEKIERNLGSLYSRQTGQTRLIMVGAKRISSRGEETNKVATYAEILSRKYSNTMTDKHTAQANNEAKVSMGHTVNDKNKAQRNEGMYAPNNEITKQAEINEAKTEVDRNILQKLAEMEKIQENILKNQQELQLANRKTSRAPTEEDKVAEQEKKQKIIEDMIDSKISQVSINQEKLVRETHESIQKEVDQLVNKKINIISITTANQVAAQLIQVFKQYMPNMNKLEPTNSNGHNPMITQESHTPPSTERQLVSTTVPRKDTYGNTDMLNELHAIEQNTTTQTSPHDKNTEQTDTT